MDYGDVAYYHQNLLVNPEGTWAYYVLGEIDWDNRPAHEHEGHIAAQAQRHADLTGRWQRMYALPQEFPASEFARRMIAEYPDAPAAPETGASDFTGQLNRKVALAEGLDARVLVPVLAVRVTAQQVKREHLPRLLQADPLPPPLGGVEQLRQELRRVTRAVARPGFAAVPVTEEGLTWVLRTGAGPGMRSPHARLDRWHTSPEDMPGFDQPITADTEELGTYTTVHGIRDGKRVTRYVTVLRVQDLTGELDTSDAVPWLGWFDSIGPESEDEGWWRVQWSYNMTVRPGREVAGELAWHRRLIDSVARHYAESGADDDLHMQRLREHAADATDEATHGRAHQAARAHGQVFVTVSAESVEVLQGAVETVSDRAAAEQDMVLAHVLGQWADYRRTIPGNVWKTSGHTLHLPVPYLAAGVPNMSPKAGDPTGFTCGNPAGSNTLHVFNGLHARRNGKAGVGVIAGAQGAGKTATAVAIVDDMCQSGVPGVAFTPDAQIANILTARHYRHGRGRVIPLTQVTTPGVAMPSLMVPVPIRNKGEAEDEYQGRVDAANAARIRYERDWLTAVLPGDMQRGGYGVSAAIENAVAQSGGAYGVSPWVHVDHLHKDVSDVAREVAAALTTRASLPTGRLGFPRRSDDMDTVMASIRATLESDALFTCVTMPGVELAKTPDKASWRDEHYDAEPILMAGLRLSSLALFSDTRPGWYIADEVDIATGGATAFTPFLRQLIYDLRRYDKFAALLVKSMSTMRGLDPDVTALLGWAGLGRMGHEGAASCLPLLGRNVDPGVVDIIPTLDDGEWFWRGWDDKVRRVPFDQSWWHPDVVAGTDTKHGHRPERLAATIKSW